MDSLVASYLSSDEEEDTTTVKSSPPSSSSTLFSVIPQPKELRSSNHGDFVSPFLSSLPPPKSTKQNPNPSLPKRVVQIRLPVNPRLSNLDEDDDEEEEKARKKRKQMEESSSPYDSSVKSFLSAMPAPKISQTLGALPSLGSGLGRRSNLETETPAIPQTESIYESGLGRRSNFETRTPAITLTDSGTYQNQIYESGLGGRSNFETETPAIPHTDSGTNQNQSYESFSHSNELEQNHGVDSYYTGYGGYEPNLSGGSEDASGYMGSYGGGSTWNGGGFEATTGLPEAVVAMDSGVRRGRRGRNEMPADIVEVKQDDLMKNRPRVDPAKSTGIAFGPAYQPESSSSKGKVSKLHKRKHQITALFMDMKHKESELAERRSRGMLTKAETQAKYGW